MLPRRHAIKPLLLAACLATLFPSFGDAHPTEGRRSRQRNTGLAGLPSVSPLAALAASYVMFCSTVGGSAEGGATPLVVKKSIPTTTVTISTPFDEEMIKEYWQRYVRSKVAELCFKR